MNNDLKRSIEDNPLPETLWIAVQQGEAGAVLPLEKIGDKQYLHFWERPKDVSIPDGLPDQTLLCKVSARTIRDSGYYFQDIGDGQWLSDRIDFPDSLPGSSWTDLFIRSKYVEYCVILAGTEWFDRIKQICEKWHVFLKINSNSIEGLRSVEYMRSRGKPPHDCPVFLVCKLGEDDYVFSDKNDFFYAHIVNPWEWYPGIDKPRWRIYKSFEDLIPRHCYGDGSWVPMEYLPLAFYCLIRNTVPVSAGIRYMRTSEEGFHGQFFLCAYYEERNKAPNGVKSITMIVCVDPDDPYIIERTLISGGQEEIFAWMKMEEHHRDIIAAGRSLLQQYEASYDEQEIIRRRKEQEEQDREFKIRNGVLIKYNGSGGDVTVPKGVCRIDGRAFFRCSSVTSVSLPEGVRTIGNNAFYECRNLVSIHLPHSLQKIGWASFYNCINLRDMELPSNLTEIGQRAFYKCRSLAKACIPDGVLEMDYGVFWDCVSLTKIVLPDKLEKICMKAFAGCTALEEIFLPSGVTEIDNSAFDDCSSLTMVVVSGSFAEQWSQKHGFPMKSE